MDIFKRIVAWVTNLQAKSTDELYGYNRNVEIGDYYVLTGETDNIKWKVGVTKTTYLVKVIDVSVCGGYMMVQFPIVKGGVGLCPADSMYSPTEYSTSFFNGKFRKETPEEIIKHNKFLEGTYYER